MSSIELLGDVVDLETTATTATSRLRLDLASGITIVAIGASSGDVTISESTARTGGTRQTLAAKPYFYTKASGVWSARTQAGTNGTVTLVTGGLAAIWIPQGILSDGFKYVDASHSAASFVYIAGRLNVSRRPVNLQNLGS